MQLTVIIPVYNGERYVAECLHSLMSQWVEGVEVIVINDGSTDRTGDIINAEFGDALRHKTLQLITTPNGGVSAARNRGLDLAQGDYVAFVDADDLVVPEYLDSILSALASSPDILEFGYRAIDSEGAVLKASHHIHTQFGRHSMPAVVNATFAACLWYPFLRVVRRTVFDGVRFPVGVRFCEDVMTFSAVYKKAATLYALPDVLYSYRINPAGATLNIRSDYAPSLIAFYLSILPDQSFANHALKVCVAYSARQCLAKSSDWLGRLPPSIEQDLRWLLVRTPGLIGVVRGRFLAYAVLGSWLYRAKRLGSKLGLASSTKTNSGNR